MRGFLLLARCGEHDVPCGLYPTLEEGFKAMRALDAVTVRAFMMMMGWCGDDKPARVCVVEIRGDKSVHWLGSRFFCG